MAASATSVMESVRVLWDYHNTETSLGNAEFIVGLGSYDLRVADRCAELHASGLAPRIIFTGATGNWTSGRFAGSEAAAFSERAVALGVPQNAIGLEQRATNIGENIRYVRDEIPNAGKIIWVTKPQTRRRLSATLDIVWPDLVSMITAPEHGLADQPDANHSFEALTAEMVGDVWRMAAYPDKGFQSPQPIGPEVFTAFNALVAAGFTDHLPPSVRSLVDY
ncbi:MAG: YdcF family protein [Hoeflea sp.]|uniref:YdcF family protein n=1 Tax=Hoeflea sp. TaxID=1940281 RepID=UPI001DA1E187|nr:YdcF family protein [Hoeflea sp.]MBU4528515.1 YdcF family protein [Alphaproteobacteria bacterium]MBU4542388.1 YdcF family protein [Alphaproteobacteria bacterium]MBU4550125.1 YdcF family protein [Alphaproteobacteria bacterium]MBV1726119.1 YdcF family protein [Hoeflea sp.]MBV1762729.1 YdcF family protein [Hoeflea sp.]